MKRLNIYFFGSEEIHPSDALWFYMGIASWILIATFTILAIK